MDFFQAQAQAQRRTKWLVVLFILGITATVIVTYVATALAVGLWPGERNSRQVRYYDYEHRAHVAPALWNPQLFVGVAGGVLLLAGGAAFFKTAQLRKGGTVVAEMVGGRQVDPRTTDLKEKRLLNVVEEMSIASGIPVPLVYVLDDEPGLNAFAAGLSTSDAVVAVTRGTLEKLNRDELQGVVAHEFSHILNGDMRMNVRLVGALFGIFFLTIVGRGLLRTLRHVRGGKKGGGQAVLVMVIVGLVFVIVGTIGHFFGRLIQAAVSRQREFLADASAVQFTRNPGGISGALKKIGGYAIGSRVGTEKAAAIGHFFFAQGMSSNLLGLLATHPPLAQRIRAIEPQFDGVFPEPPEVVDVRHESFVQAGLVPAAHNEVRRSSPLPETADTIVESIGTLSAAQVTNAQNLLGEIPSELQDAAHSPDGSQVLVLGLLLDSDPAVRARQHACVPSTFVAELSRLAVLLEAVRPEQKLPLCQLAIPALRSLPSAEVEAFLKRASELAECDGQISTFEFALQKVLQHHLVRALQPAGPGAQLYSFHAVAAEVGVVLSAVSYAATDTAAEADAAFASGASLLKLIESSLQCLPASACDARALDGALDRLAFAAFPIKQRVLTACAQIVSRDNRIRVAEAELMRAIASSLDCPMPPLLVARQGA